MPPSKDIIRGTLGTSYGEHAYKIVEKLTDSGYDTWWVGGCVRDMLQDVLPKDIDIATAATPKEITEVFGKESGGEETFGSARVKIGTDVFEVTTFREDDEASDGRHPKAVKFGTREMDAKRRDFTVNAMYWNPISGELYDPTGGEADMKEMLIRFIGDPGIRIKHDALRLLRAVRFRSYLNGQYHPDTYAALQEHAPSVEILSGARQAEELEKMLLGPHPERALEDLWELQILQRFLPELYACKGVAQPAEYHQEGDVWDHTMQCLKSFRPEDGIDVRLATLFHDAGKAETFSLKERIRFDEHATVSSEIATEALTRLKYPKKRVEKISWLIKHHMMMRAFFEMNEERKAHWYFHPWFSELLALFSLDIAGTTPSDYSLYEKILRDYHTFLDAHPRPEKPLLTGQDVMDILGLKPGEEIGKILNELHDAQVKKEVTSKKEAREFVKKLV
jgi:poly(A) polymerase